jgi:hypothetical protein
MESVDFNILTAGVTAELQSIGADILKIRNMRDSVSTRFNYLGVEMYVILINSGESTKIRCGCLNGAPFNLNVSCGKTAESLISALLGFVKTVGTFYKEKSQ